MANAMRRVRPMSDFKPRELTGEELREHQRRMRKYPEELLYDDERGNMYQHYETEQAIHDVGQRQKDRIKPTERRKKINDATDQMYRRYLEYQAKKKR